MGNMTASPPERLPSRAGLPAGRPGPLRVVPPGRSGASARSSRPNRALTVVLAVVALAAVVRFLLPSVVGGGAIHTIKPIVVPHHLARKLPAAPAGPGSAVLITRPARDPFAPPPGYPTR